VSVIANAAARLALPNIPGSLILSERGDLPRVKIS